MSKLTPNMPKLTQPLYFNLLRENIAIYAIIAYQKAKKNTCIKILQSTENYATIDFGNPVN